MGVKIKKTFLIGILVLILMIFLSSTVSAPLNPSAQSFFDFLFGTGETVVEVMEKKSLDKVKIDKEVLEKAQQFPDETQRVIIKFHKKPKNYKSFIRSLNGRVVHDYNIIEGIAVSLPGRSVNRLKELKDIIDIQEDRRVYAYLSESIPLINADDVWALGYNGSGKTVCVVDTGVNYNHPALSGKVIAQKCYCCSQYNAQGKCVKGCCPSGGEIEDDAMDDNGHGTHCAGIIASNDGIYKGVAPGVSLMAVKVLDSDGSGYNSDVIAGIEWCSNQSPDVISISLGSSVKYSNYCDSEADAEAVNNAVDAGAVVSIASGNDGWTDGIGPPACASKAIAVGAVYDADRGQVVWSGCTDSTTYTDKIVCFTNRNEILDLLAPGALIISTVLNDEFDEYGGTSMAAPHVSGAAALLLEAKPSLTPSQVEGILKNTGVSVYDSGSGLTFPRIDVLAAISLGSIGSLEPYIIDIPSEVEKDKFFTVKTGVKCVNGSCGDVSATLTLPQSQPTTCSDVWGGDCSEGPPESFDNTFDSCSSGLGGDESINEIYLDKSEVNFGEEIEVKCAFILNGDATCNEYYAEDDLYIYYRNSSSEQWRQIKAFTSNVFNCQNYSVSFIPDSVEGEHQVRCIVDYDPENDECAGGNWHDNDDINFSVHDHTSGKGKLPMNYGNPFYTNQNPLNCLNMTNQSTCNQTWTVNATGDIGSNWLFYTIYESNYNIETKETGTVNVTILNWSQPYGSLNVILNTPTPGTTTNVIQNQTFWVNATVTCSGTAGALCGNISANARYNSTTGGGVSSESWWDSSWGKRKEINFTNNDGALSDFPVYLDISKETNMQADYDDLRFINGSCIYDSSVILSYEIENYTATNAHIWLKIPDLQTGTTSICMYYNNSAISSGEDAVGVWDDNYIAVYHMDELAGGGVQEYENPNISFAGVRESSYGLASDEVTTTQWGYAFDGMHNRAGSSKRIGLFNVAHIIGNDCYLEFSGSSSDPNIVFGNDIHDSTFTAFDVRGDIDIYLGIELGEADPREAIRQVLDHYSGHSCVKGIVIDLEWWDVSGSGNYDTQLSKAMAESWLSTIQGYNTSYKLILRHPFPKILPPPSPDFDTDIWVSCDDQGFLGLNGPGDYLIPMFQKYVNNFSTHTAFMQIGYNGIWWDGGETRNDKDWWGSLNNPPLDIMSSINDIIVANPGQEIGVVWADFSLQDSEIDLLSPPSPPSSTVEDSTINGHDSSAVGLTSQGTAIGVVDGAGDFESSNTDYVQLTEHNDFDLTTGVTVEAWINPESLTSWSRIFEKPYTSNSPPYTRYALVLDGANHINLELSISGANEEVAGSTVLNSGILYYVAGTYDTSDQKVYLDGKEDGTTSQSGNIDTNNVAPAIGRSNFDNPSNYFDGIIDEVRISKVARSADWIDMTYQYIANQNTLVVKGSEESLVLGSGNETMVVINNTVGVKPFYTISAQTQHCVLNQGESCQLSWNVNATGKAYDYYKINVNFSSDYTQVLDNVTKNATVNITTVDYPPTQPTALTCNGGSCDISVDENVLLTSSGSTDPENDEITYSIEASLQNITTVEDTNDVNMAGSSDNYFYDVESGMETFTAVVEQGTTTAWADSTFGGSGYYHSATHAFWADDNPNDATRNLLYSKNFSIGASASNPKLRFWLRVITEDNYDGCWLDYSIDGGAWTNVDNSMIDGTSNDYTGECGPNCPSPDHVAWENTVSLRQVTVSIPEAAKGNDIAFRWVAETDTNTDGGTTDGCWVDDIEVDGGGGSTSDTNTTPTDYNLGGDYDSITSIKVKVEVDSYNPSASVQQLTSKPDLFLEISGHPIYEITAPLDGAEVDFGDLVNISVEPLDPGDVVSVSFYINNALQYTDYDLQYEFTWDTMRDTLGSHSIKAVIEYSNGSSKEDTVTIQVPLNGVKEYTYEVINEYPHDDNAYTQGLIWENGNLYEGTGLTSQSTLRRVDLTTGTVLQIHNLDDIYFGEGITIYEDEIFQLTYTRDVCFVYNKTSFDELDSFSYTTDTSQGWGLTYDGEKLIVTDGGANMYFWDPETYAETGEIEVTEDGSPRDRLNELEYFYNKVFANIYTTNYIVMIDVPSGKVVGKIDFTGLKTAGEYFNGIAYDKDNDRIFVTGKEWPNLFEVKLVPVETTYSGGSSATNYVEVGEFNLDGTYSSDNLDTTNHNFSLTITDPAILTAWQTSPNQNIRIKGIYMDYYDENTIDEINYTNVWVEINGKGWNELGNHTNETELIWYTVDLPEQTCIDLRCRANDLDGSNTYSDYFTKGSCLNISHGNQPPVAIAVGPSIGIAGVPLQFDGSASYDPDNVNLTYYWQFGNGDNAAVSRPIYTYPTQGNYFVNLTVTDPYALYDIDDHLSIEILAFNTPKGEGLTLTVNVT